ncbi:MAG: PAS domain S-box protein, partial [Deltaproteobacteria bacterium]|nr:PAS domain S-box protein [Deltaproteobacteria bacterium]
MFIFNLKSGLQPWVAQTRRGRFLYALAWMSGVVTLALSSVVYSQPVVEAERIIGARVIEGPVFVDASSNNFPPINYLSEDGELLGFGQELAQAVLGATGARVQHKHSDRWPEVVGWVESGEADFIHNIGYTPEREKTLDYTTPIFSMPEVIFVQDEHLDIQSFEDVIRDGSVACVRENITHQYLKRFKEITCKIYETPLAALKGLVNGEVHSLIFPKQVIQYLAQRYDLSPYIKIVGDPLRTLQWSMAVKKGNAAMQERLNRGLARVRESGEYQRIYDRHFGQKVLLGYSQLQVALASALASMVSVLLVGGALVAWFIRRLRRDKQVVEQNIAERMATEAQLRESEYQLRHVADNLPTTILITRQSDGTILYGNPAAESILGLPPSAFLGRRSTEFYAEPEQRTAVIEELKTKGNIRGLAMVVKRPNGDRVEVVLDLQPMFYLGEPALLLTAHDITKRVQTEQEREKLLVQMGARIRELACLYHISSLVRAGGSLAEVLRSAVEVLPLGFQHPQQTGVRIRFGHEEFQSGPLPKTPHVLSVQLRVGERVEGTVEVFAWGDSISPGKEFLDEERALLNGVSDTLAEFISRRRAEEALHLGTRMSGLMQRISVAANASDHQNQAFHACLQEVCAFTGWQVGHVYLVEGEDSDLLRPSGVWHLADPERFTTFKEVTLQTTFRRGEGLPGRVLESGRPLWIPNVLRDEGFLRAKHHGDLHVRTGVGFPVFTGEMVSAVVEFFSPEETSENPGLIEMLGHIGMVLGRVMERNRAERALLDAQINLSVASHLAKLGSWELNTETGSLRVSEEVLSILGVQGGSLEPTVEAFLGVVHPEDREDVSARLRISTKTGSDFEVEHRVLLPTGEVRTVINKAEVFQNLSGTVVRMIGALQDISSRKLAEVELRNSENRFRLLIEGSIQGVSVHRDGRLLFVNKALADMFGYHSVEEMLSMGMIDRLLHSEEQPRMQEYEKLRLEGGPAPRAYVFKGVRADNTSVWISNQVSVVDWNGQQAILSTMFDVSEQHRLEEQLRQAQKMEAVGLLAGGVAHDFNNMLQIISGYTQMALQHKDNVTKMESDLGRALAASHSAADLTRQLLAFSRQEVLTRKSLDLGHQVSQRM